MDREPDRMPIARWVLLAAFAVLASSSTAGASKGNRACAALASLTTGPSKGDRACKDPCIQAAQGALRDCVSSATGAFQDAVAACIERDVDCVAACRSERQDCRDATGIGEAFVEGERAHAADDAQCRAGFPPGPIRR